MAAELSVDSFCLLRDLGSQILEQIGYLLPAGHS